MALLGRVFVVSSRRLLYEQSDDICTTGILKLYFSTVAAVAVVHVVVVVVVVVLVRGIRNGKLYFKVFLYLKFFIIVFK